MVIRAWILVCLIVASAAVAAEQSAPAEAYASPAADAGPTEVVAALEAALVSSMRSGSETTYLDRARRLGPVVRRVVNHERMAALVLGAAWRELESRQRERFVGLLEDLSVATYARRFADYSGERFEQVESRELREDRAVVRTRMIRPRNDPVAFSYTLMRDADAGWQVVGIHANGVSELAIRRTQYARLYAEGGLDAVIRNLQAELDNLARS